MGSNPRQTFKRKLIASSVAAVMFGATHAAVVHAEEAAEEVVVTGIRASLEQAMDIKKEAVGVVDAISAEDIGKMPDSNLGESLQRISGVSISRNNGEGAKITVRGVDSDYNMVTLNGRNMPAVTNGQIGDQASRAFDFGNLASEGVNGVEVYKTGKASITTGGLGATVNIKTLRPLDAGETKATFGVKALHDTTVREGAGDDFTPELSGLYSFTNEDETLGLAINGSYQKRDNMRSNAFVSQWNVNRLDAGEIPYSASANVVNAPQLGELYSMPTDIRYSLEDVERIRKNAQVTLQFRPVENLTGTLDYTFSENSLSSSRAQQSVWFDNGALASATFVSNGAVKTPVLAEYAFPGSYKDISFAKQLFGSVSDNNSVGFNLEYDITDDFKLSFDTHKSSAKNKPTLWNGTMQTEAGMSANIVNRERADFTRDLPVVGVSFDDTKTTDGGGHPWNNGNANGLIDGGDISGSMGTMHYALQQTHIDQTKLNGTYNFGDLGFFTEAGVDFGVEQRTDKNQMQKLTDQRVTMGNWGGVSPDLFHDSYFTARDFGNGFEDYDESTGNVNFIHSGAEGDARKMIERVEYLNSIAGAPAAGDNGLNTTNFNSFDNGKAKWNGTLDLDRVIEEEVTSIFGQYRSKFDIGSLPANIVAGVRYEKTDLTSTSAASPVIGLRQDDNDDWTNLLGNNPPPSVKTSSYSNVLPSVDFDVTFIDNLKARFSISKTMARAKYADLRSDVNITANSRAASTGDPDLKPMESLNIDLSVEWYYTDSSYISAGVFSKDVKNFFGRATVTRNWNGLRDHRLGPRADAARATIVAENREVNAETLFDQMIEDAGLPDDPSSKLFAVDGDPLMQFVTAIPVNSADINITGFEISGQHLFGESGFGIQGNITTVESDKDFVLSNELNQTAMVGLSDSANIMGFYDKHGVQLRAAYNWRDNFLENTNHYNNEPRFTDAFGTLDLTASYSLTENLTVSLEGLNVLSENSRQYGRSEQQLWSLEDLGPRYSIGGRYTF